MERKKVIHIHSNVPNKQPSPSMLEFGEIAVNNAKGNEFLSIKNDSGDVVTFSSDEQMITWMEKKEVFPYSGTVEDVDLNANTSNVGIKFNQKASKNSPNYQDINDGSFQIDMSRYAMIGANPSFSSITVDNGISAKSLNAEDITASNKVTTKDLDVTNDVNISGKTNISGETKIDNTLTVTGNANISGDTNVGNNLKVTNGITADTVSATTSIKSPTISGTDITASNSVKADNVSANTITASTSVTTKDLNVSGNAKITGTTDIAGATTINNTLTVNGETLLKNTTVDGSLLVNSGATIHSGISVDGGANITGNTNLNGNLTVTGDTSLKATTATSISATSVTAPTISGTDITASNSVKADNVSANTITAATSVTAPTISGTDITASNSVKANNVSANTITAATSVTTKDLDVSGNGKINNLSAGTLTVSGDTNLKGDVTIDGKTIFNGEVEFEEPIKFESACPQKITATTIGDAICEAFDRSVITIEKDTSPSDTRLATVYTVKQNGQTVNTIEVAKDKVLKSAETVKVNNEWYIRLTWITFDPDTQTEVETTTDVSVASLVKDIDDKNPNGLTKEATYKNVVVDVWYENGQNWVSANTTSNIHASGDLMTDGKLIVSGDTVLGGKLNVSGNTTLKNVTATTFSAGTISASTIVTPSGLSKSLKWSLGSPSADTTGYNGSAEKTITIPGQFEHLENYDGTKFNLSHPVSITGNVTITGEITASGAIYSSDRDLKENIQFIGIDDINKIKNVPTRSFNFKDDESKRKTYGVIAQEVQDANLNELVHVKDDGKLGVDYTSLYALKIAYLENMCNELNGKIVELENKLNKLENKD